MKTRKNLLASVRATTLATTLAAAGAATMVSLPAQAQPGLPAPGDSPSAVDSISGGPTIDLTALIARVAEDIDREFILDARVPTQVRLGSTEVGDADYDTLLALLRLNGFVAVDTADDQILVLPEAYTRWSPSRVLNEDDDRVSDHAIVTRIIEVPPMEIRDSEGNTITGGAVQLVPVLRPMVGQNAHLVAISGSGNKLLITDHYDNVRRITEVIEDLAR